MPNGTCDGYIDRFTESTKNLKKDILIHFLHEFNGNWYVWSGNKNGQANGGPAQVVTAWKYLVARFKAKDADNVKWVWTPHGPSIDWSEAQWNKVSNYWPRDDYGDWICLDA